MQNIFKRNCPNCNKEILYKNEICLINANKKNTLCRSCNCKLNNPMKGRSVYDVWKEKYGEEIANRKLKNMKQKIKDNYNNMTKEQMEEFKNKSKRCGKENGMYGKSLYDVWKEKYGKEVADKKQKELNEKRSKNANGKNNSMYGKPSPIGSGNGWSGWYKGIYFRSILELSYLKYLIDNDIKFESGEKRNHKIQYEIDGQIKNYFPDVYLIDTQEIIEIKPYKLINSKVNLTKFEAGKKLYGNKFKVITDNDIIKLSIEEIKFMYENNEIKFINKYDLKFKKMVGDINE